MICNGSLSHGGVVDLRRFLKAVTKLNISVYAANACFFLILSVFPTLLLIPGILRYTPFEAEALTRLLAGILPGAFLDKTQQLIRLTYENVSGTTLSLTAVTAFWSASRGILGIMTGLNAIYGVREDRSYLRRRGISLVYLGLFFLVLVMTLALHVFGTKLLAFLYRQPIPFLETLTKFIDFRFFLLLILQTAVFTAMFMVLPNRRNRFRDSLPGALLASSGWLIFSDLYSIYVEKFARLSNVFGSVYAVALAMLWLYCCMTIVFWGGALNRLLLERRLWQEEI